MGKPLWASNAAESDSPVLTRLDTSSSWLRKLGVLLDLGEHLERAEDGQAGADEGKKLLIEDEEGLELDLAPRDPLKPRAGADGEDVVAGMGEAAAQFFGGGRGLHLLLYATTFIGQLDYELCHRSGCRPGPGGAAGLPVRFPVQG